MEGGSGAPLYTGADSSFTRPQQQRDPLLNLDYQSDDSEVEMAAASAVSRPQQIQTRQADPRANRFQIPAGDASSFGAAPRVHSITARPAPTSDASNNSNSAAPAGPSPFHPQAFSSQQQNHSAADSALAHQTGQSLVISQYCYRHRPDLQGRAPADVQSMEQLQTELATLAPSDQQGISTVWSLFTSAPTKQKELMLQGILNQCCFPQLSLIAGSVRELLKIDFISALPAELGYHVLSFLDPVSLCRAAQVNHQWKSFADDDVVWHGMCEQHVDRKCKKCGWGLPLIERQKVQAEQRQIYLRRSSQPHRQTSPGPSKLSQEIEASAYSSDDAENSEAAVTKTKGNGKKRTVTAALSPGGDSIKRVCTPAQNYASDESMFQPRYRPWKEVYRDRYRIGTNWKFGRCSIKTLKGHTDGVMCLQFDENILASGSYDSTIKIWDIETGEELRTLTGHTLGVRCLQFDKTKLVSGSLDGTLKMWDLKNGRILRTFPGHSGAVISLHFDGSILASGSQDKTIRARDFKNCQRIVLRGHTDWVNAVKVHSASQTLYSASDDCTVRMWDLVAKRCVRVFDQHVGQVQTVLPLPSDFELVTADDHFMPDRSDSNTAATLTRLAIVEEEGERPAPPKYMLTGGLDSTIRLWEVSTGRCVRTFFGHVEGIWAVAVDALRMVSGANDGMVKIWDPHTGRCERTFTGHSGPVTCVALSDRRMVTGSEDRDIRLYNFAGRKSTPEESLEGELAVNGD